MHCGIKEIKLNEYDSFFLVLCLSKSVFFLICINYMHCFIWSIVGLKTSV